MNVELPESTAEFATVVQRALADPGSGEKLFAVLDGLGVLDVAGAESADPGNAQLNTVTLLEEIARAGHRAAIAETIWARAAGLVADGFVGAVADVAATDGARIVPCGASATSLLAGTPDAPAVVPMPPGVTAARVEIDPGHVWLPAGAEALSLAAVDQPFAWRAAAALTVGAMAKATDMSVLHARQRVQFGKPLATFQALQFRLTECQWRLLGLRLLVREAAWRADRGDPLAEPVSAMAWLYAREVGRIVTKHAHQVHGAIGFTRELGLTTVTGSAATLRAFHPVGPAVAAVRAARGWEKGAVPPSTVLGGFRTSEVVA